MQNYHVYAQIIWTWGKNGDYQLAPRLGTTYSR